jgi:hypothetical protein
MALHAWLPALQKDCEQKKKTSVLEKYNYALESWRQTPAIALFSSVLLFHCNA